MTMQVQWRRTWRPEGQQLMFSADDGRSWVSADELGDARNQLAVLLPACQRLRRAWEHTNRMVDEFGPDDALTLAEAQGELDAAVLAVLAVTPVEPTVLTSQEK